MQKDTETAGLVENEWRPPFLLSWRSVPSKLRAALWMPAVDGDILCEE